MLNYKLAELAAAVVDDEIVITHPNQLIKVAKELFLCFDKANKWRCTRIESILHITGIDFIMTLSKRNNQQAAKMLTPAIQNELKEYEKIVQFPGNIFFFIPNLIPLYIRIVGNCCTSYPIIG